jgi:hypothetical protein
MRTFRHLLVAPLVLVTALAAPAFAQGQNSALTPEQRHAVTPQSIAATVADRAADQDTARAAIRQALGRPEVREMAEKAGMDLQRVTAAVDTLSGTDLQRASAAAQNVNQALVGGASTIVVSTTTVILALLLLLLIVIALK